MRKPTDNLHLHRSAEQGVSDELPTFEDWRDALYTLAPTSDFIAKLFDNDGNFIPYEIPSKPEATGDEEPDLSAVETLEEAVAKFGPTVTAKRKAMSLLLCDRWNTFEIRDAIKCSEALVSQARRELQQMHEAGLIAELPACVTQARSLAKLGKSRPDQTGDLHPSKRNPHQVGWREAKNYKHRAKKTDE